MKKILKKIIKCFAFLFSSFIFLNVYFPPAPVSSHTKTINVDMRKCENKKSISGIVPRCHYDVEIIYQ